MTYFFISTLAVQFTTLMTLAAGDGPVSVGAVSPSVQTFVNRCRGSCSSC